MTPASLSIGALFILGSACFGETIDFYIASSAKGKDGGIYLSSLDESSGKITPPKKIVELAGTGFLDLSPDGKSLLATSSGKKNPSGQMSLFSIGDDRSLTSTGEVSTEGNGTCHVSFDQTGKVAMFANYGSGNIGSALVGENGTFSGLASNFQHEGSSANPQRQKEPHAHSIFAGPENQYAYTCDLGTDKVEIYKIDTATGKLTEAGHASVPPGSGPRHLKFSNDGKHVYVLNELNTSVSVFKRLTDGQLERVQDLSTLPDDSKLEGMSCSEIRVHPNGKFVYTANRDTKQQGNDSLTVFEVKADGTLTRLSSVPAAVSIPRNINLSPSGKWLITGGQNSNDLAIFRINSETGALTKTGDNIPCPSPMCYVFLK